jgi:predicted AlkP superfamily phosphohydrolase/phosphomutase
MKAFIMAADAVTPEYIFDKRHFFPNICRMMENGAECTFSAYVQKGYLGSYSSRQNWASIYTGLSPEEHVIDHPLYSDRGIVPKMESYKELHPFWQALNENGLTVGLWSLSSCDDPVEIDGYTVSCKYKPIFTPAENREAPREITLCEKDKHILKYIDGEPPPRLYPKTLKQQGFSFEQVKANPQLVKEIANERCFEEILDNFESELKFWFCSMAKTQRDYPVDIIYLFTPSTDIIPHFAMYSDDNPVIIKAYQILDKYVGEFVEEFNPDITVFMSDHGQRNFKELVKCSDLSVQREAFAARDKALWMENGYIAFEAQNGGLIFSAHALTGVLIACGDGIKNTQISEMRTLDIYPTLLEMLGIKVPDGRSGFVVDIFNRPVINSDKLLRVDEIEYSKIALIQTHEVSITDIILNELYIEKRFVKITVVGEAKYEEIFRNNPRVSDFIPIDNFDARNFDEVYCGFFNNANKQMNHIRVI